MKCNIRNQLKTTQLSALLFVFLVSIILYLIERRNQGINMLDFGVYFSAAESFLKGEDLYGAKTDLFYIFKYSPVSAMFYVPFTFFPFSVAKNLYWLFLSLVAVSFVYLCFQLTVPGWYKTSPSSKSLLVILLILSMGLHLYREFAIGQVNTVLFLSYLLIISFYQQNKPMPAAFFLAIGIYFKPWGLIFLPYFILKKEFRIIFYFILFAFLLLVIPVIFYGFNGLVDQLGKWFNEMAIELRNKKELGALSNLTIFSVLYRYTPVQFLGSSANFQMVFQFIVLILLALLIVLFIRKGESLKNREVAEAALLIGFMPLIAPANYNTFLLLGLAIVILMVHFKELPIWVKILFVVGVVLQGGNVNDVWGTVISNRFLELSVVSFGAIFILFSLVFIRFRKIV